MQKAPRPQLDFVLEPIRQWLRGLQRQRQVRKQIAWIEGMQSFPARATSEALRRALANRPTPEERLLLDRVESIREALCTCNQTIAVPDWKTAAERAEAPRDSGSPSGASGPSVVRRPTIAEVCRHSSKPPRWCLLLYYLVRALRPTTCVQLGTRLGVSAAYHATALKLNRGGRLLTLESAETLALLASDNFQALELDNIDVATGPVAAALDDAVPDAQTLDYVYFETGLDARQIDEYFRCVVPRLSERAVVVFDRTQAADNVETVWSAIQEDPRIALTVDLREVAVCVIDPSIRLRGHVALEEAPALLAEPAPRSGDWQ
jgi:predicted O-methyltransferase YrrM